MKSSTLAALCCLLIGSFTRADDWPQFRGPDRTGVSPEKGLLTAWPKGGPTLAWTFKDAGIGFSPVSVSKGVVYTLGTDHKFADEYVIALDEKTGKELWRAKIGPVAALQGNVWGDGPRSTPTIDGDRAAFREQHLPRHRRALRQQGGARPGAARPGAVAVAGTRCRRSRES